MTSAPYILVISRAHPSPLDFAMRVSAAFADKGYTALSMIAVDPSSVCLINGFRLGGEGWWELWLQAGAGGAYKRFWGDVAVVAQFEKGAV